jgi:acyl-CoA thioesterase
MPYQIGNLREDTTVTSDPSRPGRYLANMSSNWNILYVFGGMTMATAVSAARAALSQPSFELLSVNATFLAPVQAGPLTLDVTPLRAGKGAEQLSVDLHSGTGNEVSAETKLRAVCTFAPTRRSDLRFTDLQFPDVPKPETLERKKTPPHFVIGRLPYHYSVEVRTVIGNLPWDTDWQAGAPRWAGWHRLRNNVRLPDGTLDPLVYVPAADMIGPALRQAQGPHAKLTMVISLEISLHVFARTKSEWLLQDAHVSQCGDGYVSGTVNLWDEQGVLVAQALQRALLRPIDF